MNTVTDFFSSSWIQALGWTLLHSLWQSLLCAIVVIMVLRCIPSRASNIRYAVASGGLFFIFLASVGTFLYLNTTAFPITGETEKSLHQTISISTTTYDYQSLRGLFSAVRSLIQSNIPFIVLTWSIGALLFSLRVFSGWWYIKKLRRKAIELENEWSQRVQKLAAHLSINQIITLAESSLIQAPVVIGYLKPMILIPMGMCSGLSAEQLESIFIHELIHIRRGDYFVNMIQSFLEALFFFNPFVWIVSGIIRREREHCCDDAVVKLHGNAFAYAHALATLEEARLSRSGLALSLAANKNQLLNRIKRIMEKSVKSYSGRERLVPVTLLVIGLICASWLTIQSGKSEQDLALQSNSLHEETAATDTTIKKKSARYSKKKVTTIGEDGSPKKEIVEEFEGDEDLRRLLAEDMNMIFDVPPIPAIPPMDIMMPPAYPFHFRMDTIPFPEIEWHGDRDWDEFSREFEKNFKAKFSDFYKNHEKELKNLMEEMEQKFSKQFDEEWTSKMDDFARNQEELAWLQVQKLEQNKDLMVEHEEQLKRATESMNQWEKEHEIQMEALEENMKIMEEDMKVMERAQKALEKELKPELIKDGYLGTDEKINSIQVTDDNIEINGKKIKASDQKKYQELFEKYSSGTPEKELRKRFSDHLDGRKE